MPGTVTISIEIELAWGMHDKAEYDHLSPAASAEQEALSFLLDMCERHDLRISFNIVGHLLHESCSGHHGEHYPEGWWDEDPATGAGTDPLFYAPGFVDDILTSDVPHEVCTHTYSHIPCEQVSGELLDHELTIVGDLHLRRGIPKPTSIVTPRHQRASYEVLREHGIETIRTPLPEYESPSWEDTLGPVGSFCWILFRQHPTTELSQTDGITETYCTPHPSLTASYLPNGQRSPHPAFCVIPRRIRERIHTNYLQSTINAAAENNKHVHLWTHLHNMANEAQQAAIRPGLSHLAKCRDRGELTVERMNELPERAAYD